MDCGVRLLQSNPLTRGVYVLVPVFMNFEGPAKLALFRDPSFCFNRQLHLLCLDG